MAYVNTNELKNGDIINAYNTVMRLRDRQERETKLAPRGSEEAAYFGPTVWFKVDILDATQSAIPVSWQHDWTVQGNNLAIWHRAD